MKKLLLVALACLVLIAPVDSFARAEKEAAAKPLFRDPVFDGAADPVVVWNPHTRTWWMFYTNRRANVPGLSGVAWVHGTHIGIAESRDGGTTWSHLGTADIDLPLDVGGAPETTTHWAPEIVTAPDGTHHMFLTVVPGVFEDWQHPRRIVHLTSTDLHQWNYRSTLALSSDRVIDAGVHRLADGTWRLWYNNERDRKSIYYADSRDLFTWTDRGKCTGVGERPGEGPFVFSWRGKHWMLVDLWRGLGVYRSDDFERWTAQPENLLAQPGRGADDGVNGGHPCVVVSGDRAFLFYFTHPGRAGTIKPEDKDSLDLRRSSIQVVELREKDGVLSCDRDAPTYVDLGEPTASVPWSNPLIPQRADPHIFRHTDGWYYFMGTVPEYDRLELRRARTIAELATAEPKTIWRKHAAGAMGAHIWAPEIHFIDGKWFIYFAAGAAEKIWDIRIYVLENSAANPLEGEWIERGQLDTGWESFALDATTFAHRGRRYLVWAQQAPAIKGNTNIYIAPMASPTKLAGPAVLLSRPEFPWEQVRYWVNEGPAVLARHGRIFLSYSAAGTGAEYCLGLLSADENADLLDPKSWQKSPTPVFTTSEANGIFGPGHNSFTTAPDGADLLVYHARNYRDIPGDPLRDPNRHTRVQPIAWRADGTPDFGAPARETAPSAALSADRWDAPHAANPILPGYFADPSLVQHDGKFYLYATIDPWGGQTLGCWESGDFKNWTFRELNWPTKAACTSPTSKGATVWAPSVIRAPDGRFMMFVSVGSEVWVGTAASPLGPWRDANGGRPLIPATWNTTYHIIDAEAFVDDDGSVYLYWGSGWGWKNGHCFAVKLKPDLVSFDGEPRDVTPAHYFEGPFLFKHAGRYYLTYSDGKTVTDTYQVHYATGPGPLGPFTEAANSPILVTDHARNVVSPGHHAMFHYDGRAFILYHRHRLPFVTDTAFRQTCVDELRFTPDGLIEKVHPTHTGPDLVQGRAANRLPATATASSALDALHDASRALDDNYATRWAASPTDRNATLTLDLARARHVARLELRPEYPLTALPLTLETSVDGEHWETVADHRAPALHGSPIVLQVERSCRFLRVTFPASNDTQTVSLWECAAY